MRLFTARTAEDPVGNPRYTAPSRAFLIWRAGQGCDWDCTAQDLASELGVSADLVRAICKRRGWPINRAVMGAGSGEGRMAVDAAMNDWTGRLGARV